jgi:hypothetical protein
MVAVANSFAKQVATLKPLVFADMSTDLKDVKCPATSSAVLSATFELPELEQANGGLHLWNAVLRHIRSLIQGSWCGTLNIHRLAVRQRYGSHGSNSANACTAKPSNCLSPLWQVAWQA